MSVVCLAINTIGREDGFDHFDVGWGAGGDEDFGFGLDGSVAVVSIAAEAFGCSRTHVAGNVHIRLKLVPFVSMNTSEREGFYFGSAVGFAYGNFFVGDEREDGRVAFRTGVTPLAEHGILKMVINQQGVLGFIGGDAHFGDFGAGEGAGDAEDLAEAGAKMFVHGKNEAERIAALEEEGLLFRFFGFWGWLGVGVVGEDGGGEESDPERERKKTSSHIYFERRVEAQKSFDEFCPREWMSRGRRLRSAAGCDRKKRNPASLTCCEMPESQFRPTSTAVPVCGFIGFASPRKGARSAGL